jgi:hypothetical protein
MFFQHFPAELVDLAKGHGLEPSGGLQPEADPADAAEQVKDADHFASASLTMLA